MKEESPIYSMMEYENAFSVKKNILKIQMSLLNSVEHIENYKNERKQEFMLKVKLKKSISEAKELINKLLKTIPSSNKIKKPKSESLKKSQKEAKKEASIESQLNEIKRKLEELG